MRTLFSSIALLIGGTILLSSCNQGASLSLTKRHYTKGYYVDYTSKREVAKPKELTIIDVGRSVSASTQTIQPLNRNATDRNNNTIVVSTQTETAKPIANATPAKRVAALQNTNKSVTYKSALAVVAAPQAFLKNKFQLENAPEVTTETNHDHGEGRSLFWLVITILVILWLIGILTGSFGLGAIFNLLLLIALVLFILWLLWLI